MSFFRKAFRSVGHALSKGVNEVGSAFRKGGNVIARGLGGMAGGSLGAELGSGLALAIGQPELAPAFGAVGGLIGRTAGAEGAGRIETTTRGIASGKRPLLGQNVHNVQRAHEMMGALPIPDGKFFHVQYPEKKKAMVGVGGAGQRRMMSPEQKRNELEKMRTQQKERQLFV